ncbi:4-alpha-glucanotransferase [Agarilytica rhodophyticola]|uniref:4-alpha-glucanotransferase n=1 Tax=Agarilytica rhodophyticola TaxID=1737490 RepID=UPI000B34728F|nr:4-alpha-glucanotransferase [Agarilytica rhodophyticola]
MSDLDRLFYWCGVAADYLNYKGDHIHVPFENRINLLKAMGVDVSNADSVAADAHKLDVEPWMFWLKELNIVEAGEGASFDINLRPHDIGQEFTWTISNDDDEPVRSGKFFYDDLQETGNYIFEESRYSRRKVVIGRLEPNYYWLSVSTSEKTERKRLAVSPSLTYQSSWADTGDKVWGVIIQLYTLKSDRNWGIGDFTDLKNLVQFIAAQGADVIGLNPLHALSCDLKDYFSPYSPSDRRYLNPLYLDPAAVQDFTSNITIEHQALLVELRNAPEVDYVRVRDLKYQALEHMFDVFIDNEFHIDSARYRDFSHYINTNGRSLLLFAYYEATHQRWSNARYIIQNEEQSEYIYHDLLDLTKPKTRTQLGLLFHCYLQWLSHLQLEECQNETKKSGMKIGLIRDLAVGADGGGAEVSENSMLFCGHSSVGAPPDPFSDTGQNWGLPPAIPSEMRASGYRHFIQLLRENMSSCGALRIDHAMSLMRLWWCPPGQTAAEGAYVYYPFYEMLSLLKLESYLNNCLVIGEDLGVVPDEFRNTINKAKIFTNKVFYFEKEQDKSFKSPAQYDSHSLAMVNNHDLPTLVSWWNGTDLELRLNLNLLDENVNYSDIQYEREQEKLHLMQILQTTGLCPESWSERTLNEKADADLVAAILQLSSRANSKMFVLQLEDLLLMDEPVNVPGTFKEYNNWQRKLSLPLSEIVTDKRIKQVLATIDQQRKF